MRAVVALLMFTAVACSSRTPTAPAPAGQAPPPASPPAGVPPIRVLMLTATAGFRHDSIATARTVMVAVAATAADVTVTPTEDVASITASMLADYDVLFFALTSGELPFSAEQRAAILAFVSGGKGFIGTHSATDTLYEWPDYGRLVGAYFKEHPWTQPATVIVEDPSHPTTRGIGDRWSVLEEFYTFRDNPRPRVHVLLRLDADSVGANGDYPLAWTQSFGSGRAYYNALGHFPSTWNDVRFQQQLLGAIRWTAGRSAEAVDTARFHSLSAW
jgi:type 1 glutamine amidotransferase